ncbi:MAG TPA: Hsp33 family molecular chaperone HslO [Clostridiales bacterium]|nr:Hsp33 family molecular chaperone HslO [Saccharofermentanaceae bacterium]HBY32541.1 Hsp33 family molecular chaperone HslO [Clostridiales bacterium]
MDDFYLAPGSPTDGSDYIVTATALSGKVRALAIRSTELVKEALRIHKTSPVATAALGRFLTGTLFVADTLKGEGDTITANIRSDGPLQGMTAVADSHGNVRGYCLEPVVETTYHRPGKLNVGAAVGSGKLTVVKDFGLKEPYVGQVELISGEIAEDFTYYFASSEQTPSIVSLGVGLDAKGVTCAGGFMVQLLPGADEETISYLEDRVNGGFPEVSFLLQEGMNPEKILDMFLGDKDICFLEGRKVAYKCNCSRDRMERNLMAIGKKDLTELSLDPKGIDLECHFCDQRYHFSQEDVKALISDDSE